MTCTILALLCSVGVSSCEKKYRESHPDSQYVSHRGELIQSSHQIISWLFDQCICDSTSYQMVEEAGLSEIGQYETLFGKGRREKIQCDSLWGFSRVDLHFTSFDSTIVGVVINPVGWNVGKWEPPPSVKNRGTLIDREAGHSLLRLMFDSRMNYDTAFLYEYFTVQIEGVEWVGAVQEFFEQEQGVMTTIFMIPSISPLSYLRPPLLDELDTLEGGYYHWSGYRYFAPKGLHYCWNGLFSPLKEHEWDSWQYRIKFPPEYDRFILFDEKNMLDTSCADIEHVRIIGWIGDGLWQPHGPDDIPTLYALDVDVLSVGMPDRFR